MSSESSSKMRIMNKQKRTSVTLVRFFCIESKNITKVNMKHVWHCDVPEHKENAHPAKLKIQHEQLAQRKTEAERQLADKAPPTKTAKVPHFL